LKPPRTGVSSRHLQSSQRYSVNSTAELIFPFIHGYDSAYHLPDGLVEATETATTPKEARNGASCDDPVSWRFRPGYWVGRLGRLAGWARLL